MYMYQEYDDWIYFPGNFGLPDDVLSPFDTGKNIDSLYVEK